MKFNFFSYFLFLFFSFSPLCCFPTLPPRSPPWPRCIFRRASARRSRRRATISTCGPCGSLRPSLSSSTSPTGSHTSRPTSSYTQTGNRFWAKPEIPPAINETITELTRTRPHTHNFNEMRRKNNINLFY